MIFMHFLLFRIVSTIFNAGKAYFDTKKTPLRKVRAGLKICPFYFLPDL
jgi:hypothetical protein